MAKRGGGKGVWKSDGLRGARMRLPLFVGLGTALECSISCTLSDARLISFRRHSCEQLRNWTSMMRWSFLARICRLLIGKLSRKVFGDLNIEIRQTAKLLSNQVTVKMAPIVPSQEELDRRKVRVCSENSKKCPNPGTYSKSASTQKRSQTLHQRTFQAIGRAKTIIGP